MSHRRSSAPPGWFPRRGEVCLFGLDKERPSLVTSSDALNRHALDVCIVPISTVEHKAFRLRPNLRAGEAGLDRDSWVTGSGTALTPCRTRRARRAEWPEALAHKGLAALLIFHAPPRLCRTSPPKNALR